MHGRETDVQHTQRKHAQAHVFSYRSIYFLNFSVTFLLLNSHSHYLFEIHFRAIFLTGGGMERKGERGRGIEKKKERERNREKRRGRGSEKKRGRKERRE